MKNLILSFVFAYGFPCFAAVKIVPDLKATLSPDRLLQITSYQHIPKRYSWSSAEMFQVSPTDGTTILRDPQSGSLYIALDPEKFPNSPIHIDKNAPTRDGVITGDGKFFVHNTYFNTHTGLKRFEKTVMTSLAPGFATSNQGVEQIVLQTMPDSTLALVLTNEKKGVYVLRDLNTLKDIAEIPATADKENERFRSSFSEDQKTLSIGEGNRIRVFDMKTLETIESFNMNDVDLEHPNSFMFSPSYLVYSNTERVDAGFLFGVFYFRDWKDLKKECRIQPGLGVPLDDNFLDGRSFIKIKRQQSPIEGFMLEYWDIPSCSKKRELFIPGKSNLHYSGYAFKYSTEEGAWFTHGADYEVFFWDWKTNSLNKYIIPNEGLQMSPNSRRFSKSSKELIFVSVNHITSESENAQVLIRVRLPY